MKVMERKRGWRGGGDEEEELTEGVVAEKGEVTAVLTG